MTSARSVLYRLLEPGANLHPLEALLMYIIPVWFLTVDGEYGDDLLALAKWNAACQICMFLVLVQIPTMLTGHMSYVDMGWPLGLCILAVNTFLYGSGGNQTRSLLVCGALLFHGGRMFLGAVALMFPYVWKKEFFSRYEYARDRFIHHTARPGLWWLKQQHDTLGQCAANCTVLAIPVMLTSTNPSPELHWLELTGFCCWVLSWCFENLADTQKMAFVVAAKKAGDIRTAVLGHPPYNTAAYKLWTLCRHPNYFGEWCCWNSFILMALPAIINLHPLIARIGGFVIIYCTSRFFYDCLVHWTGAAPAESRSVQRRPEFAAYQESTNVIFPFNIPWFDHHRTSQWPMDSTNNTTCSNVKDANNSDHGDNTRSQRNRSKTD